MVPQPPDRERKCLLFYATHFVVTCHGRPSRPIQVGGKQPVDGKNGKHQYVSLRVIAWIHVGTDGRHLLEDDRRRGHLASASSPSAPIASSANLPSSVVFKKSRNSWSPAVIGPMTYPGHGYLCSPATFMAQPWRCPCSDRWGGLTHVRNSSPEPPLWALPSAILKALCSRETVG